jgi:hypothetical protein
VLSKLSEACLQNLYKENGLAGSLKSQSEQHSSLGKNLITSFGLALCPSSGVFYCTFGTGKFHAGFDDRFQAELG